MARRVIAVENIRKCPEIGHVTGEIARGDSISTMIDSLPEGAVFVTTTLIFAQDLIEEHIAANERAAKGESSEAARTRRDAEVAKELIGKNQFIVRSAFSVFVQGKTVTELNKISNATRSLLLNYRFRAIATKDDPISLDRFLLFLPMVYQPMEDKSRGWQLCRLNMAQHIGNLLPFLGRNRGSDNPGMIDFNRGGEPVYHDPLNKDERKTNAHLLLLGPTGAGKSASCVAKFSHLMATKRPRMFIIEAGNSFGLMADWFKENDISVNHVVLKPGSGVSLPPFADAVKILDKPDPYDDALPEDALEEDDEDETRDFLGEMEIAAKLMITGGDKKEAELMRRADGRLIRDAIILAARRAAEEGVTCRTEFVRDAFYHLAKNTELTDSQREKIRDMGGSIGLFCDGFEGEVFNSKGEPWPDVDVTLIDLAHFAKEGYESHLAIAVMAILNQVNHVAERDQHNPRPIIVPIDEAHIITTNPLLAPFLVKIVKMWRKLGTWLWLATQNLEDFPAEAKKMLNMIEWWVLLVMPKEEIEQVSRFRDLTAAQRQLLVSAQKEPRKYTEGVILSRTKEIMFRSVPPSLILALGMTEKHEKAERYKYMEEHGISEVQASYRVARKLDEVRGIRSAN